MNAVVIIPTYNERDNLDPLVRAILANPGYRVMVVDDNSPDGTGALADALAAEFTGRVEVLHRTSARGLGRSLRDGLKRASESDAEIVFQMDADLSHDPQYLPAMASATADADLVIGSRYLQGVSVVNWPLRRIFLSAFANRYIRAVTGLRVADCTSGYRCWRREALRRIPLDRLVSEGYAFVVEMLYRAHRAGCRVREVPIIFIDRHAGSSKMSKKIVREAVFLVWKLKIGTLLRRFLGR
jgi:dolichol-phosphate mannosyltransferase